MRGTKVALFLLLLLSEVSVAQFTQVNGTVTDPNGLPYANGTITPKLVLPGGTSPTLGGLPYTPPSQPAGLNSTGTFIMQLADNTQVSPGGTQWTFTTCSALGTIQPAGGRGPVCFTIGPLTISGTTQSITTQLTAAALALGQAVNAGNLPSASAAGQLPVSTGAGNNYVAQTKVFIDARDILAWDGSTDDTAALNAAIVDHTTIFFTSRKTVCIQISQPINVSNHLGVKLIGDARGAANQPCFTWTGPTSTISTITCASNVLTVATTTTHKWVVGESVLLSGNSTSAFNTPTQTYTPAAANFTVDDDLVATVPSGTSITVNRTCTNGTGNGGSVTGGTLVYAKNLRNSEISGLYFNGCQGGSTGCANGWLELDSDNLGPTILTDNRFASDFVTFNDSSAGRHHWGARIHRTGTTNGEQQLFDEVQIFCAGNSAITLSEAGAGVGFWVVLGVNVRELSIRNSQTNGCGVGYFPGGIGWIIENNVDGGDFTEILASGTYGLFYENRIEAVTLPYDIFQGANVTFMGNAASLFNGSTGPFMRLNSGHLTLIGNDFSGEAGLHTIFDYSVTTSEFVTMAGNLLNTNTVPGGCAWSGSPLVPGTITGSIMELNDQLPNGVICNWVQTELPITTIGNFPTCTGNTEGAHPIANNCNAACTVGGTCTAGGTTHCEMYCNGSAYVETGR